MNGLLGLMVLVTPRPIAPPPSPMLFPANAFAASPRVVTGEAMFTPRSAEHRSTLTYSQWVALLRAEARAAETLPRQTILLGDSLTLWFPAQLLPGHRSWLNQGISGENSSGLLNRLNLLDHNSPDTIFMMIGINDLIWGGSDAALVDNIKAAVQYLKTSHPQSHIVVQSILPHGGQAATWEGRDRLLRVTPQRIVAINNQIKQIAGDSGVTYLNLYPLFVNGDGYLRPDLTTDGLHLNSNGYLVWRTALAMVAEQ
ncbi:MAG: lysophospholipase [Cyanobacteria bacterium REEB459]|nr:lysophospholipase [Cyanobacteria bacterium REEB459]